jgi:F-type H+-transporting ATPase subunit epsilon
MSSKTIKFEIVTPDKAVLEREILQVSIPTTSGEITVLPGHIPLVSVISSGVIEVRLSDNSLEIFAISGGFLEVSQGKVIILADTAERAEELDEERIKAAQERAEKLKEEARNVDDVQFAAVAAKLEKELARLRAVSRWRRLKGVDNK